MANADALAGHGLRYYPIVGDGFEPRLRGGRSGVFATPVDGYRFEGLYVFKDGSIYRAERRIGGTVWFRHDNPIYGDQEAPTAWFNDQVEAMVVAEVTVQVPDYWRFAQMAPRPVARLEAERVLLAAE